MRVYGVWMLQKRVYKGTETCKKGLYVWYMLHFTSTSKKYTTLPGEVHIKFETSGKIVRMLLRKN
jgi:hypothetical protein